MKRTNLFKVTALALTAVMALTGCSSSSSSAESDTVTVGVSFPMSGSVAADGELIVNAIQLAVDEYNAAGGINGKTILLEIEDDEANPTTAASVANLFVENDDILSVITSYNSSCGLAQIPVFKEAGLSAISPVTTSPSITGMSDYYYRTCNSDTYVGALGADCLAELGWEKIAVLYEQDDYGYGIYETFTARAEEIGIDVAYTGTFVYGETKDFSTLLSAIKEADVDGIYFIGLVTEMGLMANQASTFGVADVPVFADEGCYSPAMIEEGGDAVEGLYTIGAFSANSTDGETASFVSDYESAYTDSPSNWAALGYDAACTLFEAMLTCETLDRESVNNALQVIEYEGITGMNKFTNSDVAKDYGVYQIVDGEFVDVVF